ncbi:hypothetical protein CDL15_Pgr003542 [Punica granatum]|uniref:Uncharacterized protein n=1 Tax=Punica granatum TaxID=22663 RepID=A0A218X3S9_PUNGR|nr:hypothetical protein CDL15_Pgr003542 [Punica granatum]
MASGLHGLDLSGNLLALEHLSMAGCPWCWRKLSKVLRSASKVKHLQMAGNNFPDSSHLITEFDIVDLFGNHSKLERL